MNFRKLLHQLNRRDTKILPKFNKFSKILIFCLVIFCSVFVVRSILAQSSGPEYLKAKQDAIVKGNNQEAWMNESMSSNMVSVIQAIGGPIPNSVLTGTTTPDGKPVSYLPGGAIGMVSQLTSSLYTPAASGIQYIASIKDNFLGKPAYAQGVGFQGLQPILPIWREFRNVIYVLTSLFFITIGIMVMLRVKISPQAIVTLQSAIPQLIITLILVTFSYAIAGFLIDLSYVVQGLFLAVLFNSKGGISSQLFQGGMNPKFSDLAQPGFTVFLSLMYKATPMWALMLIAGAPVGIITGLIAAASAVTVVGLPVAAVALLIGGAGFLLVYLIILIMLLVWVIQFFFGCVKCYIMIIIKIILAPLEIGLGALPNSKLNFSTWIWDLVANLAVFPISLIFLVLANMIIDASTQGLWAPAIIGGGWPILNLTSGGLVSIAVGLATMMILAKLPKMIPEFIFQIKPSPFGKAIGETFAPIGGYVGGGIKGAGRYGANTTGRQMQANNSTVDPTTGTRTYNSGQSGLMGRIGAGIQYFTSKQR